ncbi:MAG: hypothetical protein RL508_595 [Actinomycetota bacterium]|jgi:uncharacterized RDD family membrane protein YckC
MTNSPQNRWAGERLGLPQHGSGSLATMPRRIGAIMVDWAIAMLLSNAFFKADSMVTLIIFGTMQFMLVGTLGFSFGHRIFGLRVMRGNGSTWGPYVGLWKALVRSVLLCLVIPVAIWDNDNRGVHDKAAGTVLVRR